MKRKMFYLITMCVLSISSISTAQVGLAGLFDSGASKKDGEATRPTLIDSDTMDMDIQNNIAIFIGDVVVDSDKLHITCQRMEMYMVDEEIDGKTKKQLKEIHCYKNREGNLEANDPTDKRVVIIRTLQKNEVEEKGQQRSFSGKAVYNIKTGEIVLTHQPIIVQGFNEIHGSKITIWRDTDVMKVRDGHIRYIEPDNNK